MHTGGMLDLRGEVHLHLPSPPPHTLHLTWPDIVTLTSTHTTANANAHLHRQCHQYLPLSFTQMTPNPTATCCPAPAPICAHQHAQSHTAGNAHQGTPLHTTSHPCTPRLQPTIAARSHHAQVPAHNVGVLARPAEQEAAVVGELHLPTQQQRAGQELRGIAAAVAAAATTVAAVANLPQRHCRQGFISPMNTPAKSACHAATHTSLKTPPQPPCHPSSSPHPSPSPLHRPPPPPT